MISDWSEGSRIPLSTTGDCCRARGCLDPNRVLAAAPCTRGRSPKRATPIDVARFSGRRGFGTPKTLRLILGPERAHRRHAECDAPTVSRLARSLKQFKRTGEISILKWG